jgi:hypothetical protein
MHKKKQSKKQKEKTKEIGLYDVIADSLQSECFGSVSKTVVNLARLGTRTNVPNLCK